MTNYRDPKVTTPKKSSTMTWLGIALAVLLVLLLLLLWLFWPADEEEEVIAPEQDTGAEVVTPEDEDDPSQDPDVVAPEEDEPVPAPAE